MPSSSDDVAWVDVLPSLDKFTPALRKALGTSMSAAGKQAGADFSQALQKQAVAGVEAASDKLAAARNKEADAAGRLTVAEKRLQELRDSGKAKASQLAAAQEAVAKAQRSVADTMSGTERAARQLAEAQGRAAESAEELGRSGSRIEGFADNAKRALVGVVAAAAAAGGAMVQAFTTNVAAEQGNDKLAAQLGLSPQEAQAAGRIAGALYRDAYGESLEQVNTAVSAVVSSIQGMRGASEAELQAATATVLDFASAFDVDVTEAASTAGLLIRNGFAKDSTEAFDLMTEAFQSVPAAMRAELPEILNEYGTNFRALGFSGEQAFGLLVRSAQDGQFSLDKTGDALKEFSIRATDMSATSVGAYERIGLNAGEMANAILAGGETARVATAEIAQGILSIEDPAERANTAIALFGTPLEDLSVDQIPQFLEVISSADQGLESVAGSAAQMGQTLNDNFATRMEGWKRQAAGFAQEGLLAIANGFSSGTASSSGWQGALEQVGAASRGVFDFLRTTAVPALQGMATWMSNNQGVVYGFAAALGALVLVTQAHAASMAVSAAGGIAAWIAQTRIATAITQAWTAVQWLWNAAMAANPIVLVGIALAALVAGLVIAYQRSETFRNIVQGAFAAVAEAGRWMWENVLQPVWAALLAYWGAVADGISWAWNNVIKPVWDFIAVAAQALFVATAIAVFGPMLIAWKALSEGVQWAWANVLKPAWDAVAAAAQWLWANALQPVFGWISAGWDALLAGVRWAWENVLRPTWNAVQAAAEWLWGNVLRPVFDFIGQRWDNLLTNMRWVWENVLRPTWDALRAAAEWLWNSILRPVFDAIGRAWDGLGRGMQSLYTGVIAPIFDWFGRALTTIRDSFGTAVDWIGRTWDSMRERLRGPVQWVVDVVWNNGLRSLWNTINNLWGGEDLDPFRFAAGGVMPAPRRTGVRTAFATGGILPGYTPGRDVHHFVSPTGGRLDLSGGEAIMVPEFTRAVGPAGVDLLNRLARQEGAASLQRVLTGGPWAREGLPSNRQAFAAGGIVELPGWLDTALRFIPGGGAIRDIAGAITGAGAGGGLFGDGLIKLAKSIVGKLWEKAQGMFGGGEAGGGGFATGRGGWPPAVAGRVAANTAAMVAAVRAAFPQIRSIGTLGSRPNKSDHPMGKAADFMIPGWSTPAGKALGYSVASFLRSRSGAFGLKYLIFDDLIDSGAGWRRYTHPNGPTANATLRHLDHVHASVYHQGGVVPDRGNYNVPAILTPDERVLTPSQDRYTDRLVTATLAAERKSAAGRPSQFVGDLYLDSGEFLGKVRGVAGEVVAERDGSLARNVRSAWS